MLRVGRGRRQACARRVVPAQLDRALVHAEAGGAPLEFRHEVIHRQRLAGNRIAGDAHVDVEPGVARIVRNVSLPALAEAALQRRGQTVERDVEARQDECDLRHPCPV